MLEHYIYTDLKCEECKGKIVYDPHRNEYYCLNCGLVQENNELKLEGHVPSNLKGISTRYTGKLTEPSSRVYITDEFREENEFLKREQSRNNKKRTGGN